MGAKIKIKDSRGHVRTVGDLEIDSKSRIFTKHVERDKHYMKVVKGYGIQKEVFDEYLRGRKGIIRIHEKDTDKWLIASVETWTDHNHTANYGDGKQVFLGERFMHNGKDFDRSVLVKEGDNNET